MANMFSGNQEKKIPKSMDDCIKPDSVSTNLWVWCERLEKWGKILFWVLIVGGLILSISTSIVEKEVVVREATYWGEAETELRKTFDFEIFIPLLLETALYAFLEYCAYHILALLVGSLASIVQNTKISANVALYNTTYNSINKVTHNNTGENSIKTDANDVQNNTSQKADNGNQKIQSIIVSKICDNDKCSRCGDIVDVYESEVKKLFGTAHQKLCKECLKKYEQEEYIIIERNDNNNHKWRCSSCGEMINTKTCPYCGISIKDNIVVTKETEENKNITTLEKANQCECGEMFYGIYCPVCGKKAKSQPTDDATSTVSANIKSENNSRVCQCGERFYGDICPNCGRKSKA